MAGSLDNAQGDIVLTATIERPAIELRVEKTRS